MKLDPILTKAVRFARKKNYDNAIKTLESEANRYYGSYTYYYLLGASYLYANIFGVALSYLKLALEQKMRDPNAMLGLAALYLNHGDTDKAVDLYLEVQTIDRGSKIAARALRTIRKYPGPENISSWIDSGKLPVLFPPFPKPAVPPKNIALGIFSGLIAAGIAFGICVKTDLLSLPQSAAPREVPEETSLVNGERAALVQTGGSYRYVLTENQVLDEYNEARKLFTQYRDDAAKVRLNHILESNASEPVKNRARLLLSYTAEPGFTNLKDRFSWTEVTNNPFMYRDCHVIWRGMISGLEVQQNHTAFVLLVGYDTRRKMEGDVQVDFNFAVAVNPEYPVEILGRVIPVSNERETGIRIQGVALNQAGLMDQAGSGNTGGN